MGSRGVRRNLYGDSSEPIERRQLIMEERVCLPSSIKSPLRVPVHEFRMRRVGVTIFSAATSSCLGSRTEQWENLVSPGL